MEMGGRRHALAALHPGKETVVQEPGGLQGQCVRVRRKNLSSGFHPRTVQLVASRYTDWANTAHKAVRYPEWMSTNRGTVYRQTDIK